MRESTFTNAICKAESKQISKDFAYCEDAVSRQAAIDALDGEITVTGRANAEAVRGYANLVCDRIKRLPSAQPEPKWIPCRESNGNIHPYSELLHESKGILVTYKTRTGRRYVKQVLCNHGRVEKILLGDIVAWLPLPTPYREDEEE